MKTVIFREQFGPAESDYLSSIIGMTQNPGRKLFRLVCDEILASDSGWLTVRAMFEPELPPVILRIPIQLVLVVLTREDERTPAGFVGPVRPTAQTAPIDSPQPDTRS